MPSADKVAGGTELESAGEADAVAVGVLTVGDAAGDEGVGNDEGDGEADADGDAGTEPDGLVSGDGDTVAVADDVGTAEGGTEQCVAGRVGIGDVPVPFPGLWAGEARAMAAAPAAAETVTSAAPSHAEHFCRPAVPGGGEGAFPVPFPPWGPRPPGKVPFPFVVPPPPLVPPLPFPVSTVEPTCTMASRSGGTARLRHAMNTMPASMATTGRNSCHDDRRDHASRADTLSRPAQYPRRA